MSRQAKKEQDALLGTLAELGGKLTAEEDVVFKGTKLILPERMDLKDAIRFLQDKEAEDEEEMRFHRIFRYRPWDGARATDHALRRAFGMTRATPIQTMFGKQPPQMITITTGVGEQEQVPWGCLEIPLLPGAQIYLGAQPDPEMGMLFSVMIQGPRKYRFHAEGIFRLIQDELETNSMYRGKAFDGRDEPEFLDVRGVDPEKVIYSDDVLLQLEANVWSLLRHTDVMRSAKMPLKRAALLAGPYGTGKTLAAFLTAKEAVANGWTFIYCRPGRDSLQNVMATAQLYQPSVVFFEDVDVISDAAREGADSVSQLLDVFDGIQTKDTEIVCILTTNHVENIHKGMLRPGRLDAVIEIGALDRNGIERLVRSAVPTELLDTKVDYDAVAEAMVGYLPAFVKEAVDRSVRYSISRGKGVAGTIQTEDLVNAADGLRAQFTLMSDAEEHGKSDPVSVALTSLVREAVHGAALEEDDRPFGTVNTRPKSSVA
jgi:transitional endoplasmic reticulum ATPase